VAGERVDQRDVVAPGGQVRRVGARSAADVEDPAGPREEAVEDVPGPQAYEVALAGLPEPGVLVAHLVPADHARLDVHTDQSPRPAADPTTRFQPPHPGAQGSVRRARRAAIR
jgi:hypothetical protein